MEFELQSASYQVVSP